MAKVDIGKLINTFNQKNTDKSASNVKVTNFSDLVNGKGGNNGQGVSMEDLGKAFSGAGADIKAGGANAKSAIISAAAQMTSNMVTSSLKFAEQMSNCNTAIRLAEIQLQKIQNKFKNDIDKIDLEAGFKQKMLHLETYMKNTENLMRASFQSLIQGINEGTWAAYDALLEARKAEELKIIESERIEQQRILDIKKRESQYSFETMKAENDIRRAEMEKTKAKVGAGTGFVGGVGEVAMQAPIPWVAILGAALKSTADIVNSSVEAHQTFVKNRLKLSEASAELSMEYFQQIAEMNGIILDNETNIKKAWTEYEFTMKKIAADLAKGIEGYVREFNDAATKFVSLYGYVGGELEKMKRADIFGGVTKWAVKHKITQDEIISNQSAYQTTTGRNVRLNEFDVAMASFINKYTGDSGYAGKISSELQAFNKSIVDSGRLIANRMASLERSGLSGRKYAQDIAKYINLANKYNFKGGTEGLAKMVEYAQKTKFNMDSLSGSLDKFSSNDISSVLEASARLNVLGGNAALFSDPIGMMHDALNDPDAFAKRITSMFSEYGRFNTATGEMKYDEIATRMMAVIAEQTGMSVEDMRKINNEAEKRRQIEGQMSGKGFAGDQLDFLIANSFWDKKTGKWTASLGGGGTVALEDLTDKMIDKVMPQTTEDRMEQITWSVTEISHDIGAFLGQSEKERFKDQDNRLMQTQGFYDGMMAEFNKRMDISTSVIKQAMNLLAGVDENGNGISMREAVMKSSQDATTALEKLPGITQEQMKKLADNTSFQTLENLVRDIKNKLCGTDETDYKKLYDKSKEAAQNAFAIEWKNKKITNPARGQAYITGLGLSTESFSDEQIYALGQALHKASKKSGNSKDFWNYIDEDYASSLRNHPLLKKYYQGWASGPNGENTPETIDEALKVAAERAEKLTYDYYTKTQDAITPGRMFSPSSKIVTAQNDINMSWKPGGPLDTLFNGVAGKVNVIGDFVEKSFNGNTNGNPTKTTNDVNLNVNFGGRAEIASNSTQTNIADALTNDPFFTRKLAELVLEAISTLNGGRKAVRVQSLVDLGNIFR